MFCSIDRWSAIVLVAMLSACTNTGPASSGGPLPIPIGLGSGNSTLTPAKPAAPKETLTVDGKAVPVFAAHKVSPQGIFPNPSAAAQPKAGDYDVELTLISNYPISPGFDAWQVPLVSLHLKHYPEGAGKPVRAWKSLNQSAELAKLTFTETKTRLTGTLELELEGYEATAGERRRVRYEFDLPYTP